MSIEIPGIYKLLAEQEHLLIGGTTGSGKSTVINGIMAYLLGTTATFVLIDPKGTELCRFADLDPVARYAVTEKEIKQAVRDCVAEMQERFKALQDDDKTNNDNIYIIIDEYAFIRYRCGKDVEKDTADIAFRGRAAGLHLIIATQRPTRDIVGGMIAANCTAKLALRTVSMQESRNIIGRSGAELLPRYGKGILQCPDLLSPTIYDLPKVEDQKIQQIINQIG